MEYHFQTRYWDLPFYKWWSCRHKLLVETSITPHRGRNCFLYISLIRCRGSSVSIVTRLRAGRPGFTYRQGHWCDCFSSPPHPDRIWVPPSLLSNEYRGLLPGGWVKRLRRETDKSPPSSVEVKNVRSYTSTPPYVLMAWCLVNNFTCPFNFVMYSSHWNMS